MDKITFKLVILLLLAAVAGGVVGAGTILYSGRIVKAFPETTVKTIEERLKIVDDSAITDVVAQAQKSVVSIVISKEVPLYESTGSLFDNFFSFPYGNREVEPGKTVKQKVGGGSGFIIASDGLILTNRHVVADEEAEYSVLLNDGKEYPAKVLDRDTVNDLAFVKIEAKDLTPIELGDSDSVKIGQTVIAIGNTLAEYSNTVTKGIISGINRKVTAGDALGGESILDGAFQTDAAINPGNSGGPLVNLAGQVIGINTAVNRAGEAIGFAIPINEAKQVVESVKKDGRIVRPFLGVRYSLIDEATAKAHNLSIDHGAVIVGDIRSSGVVKNSPAEKAGLKDGDIIYKIEDKDVTIDQSLAKLLSAYKPGDKVTMRVKRDKEDLTITVTLGDKKDF